MTWYHEILLGLVIVPLVLWILSHFIRVDIGSVLFLTVILLMGLVFVSDGIDEFLDLLPVMFRFSVGGLIGVSIGAWIRNPRPTHHKKQG